MNRFTPDLSLGVACRNRQDDLVLSAHWISTLTIPHHTRTPCATDIALHSCLVSIDPIGVAVCKTRSSRMFQTQQAIIVGVC